MFKVEHWTGGNLRECGLICAGYQRRCSASDQRVGLNGCAGVGIADLCAGEDCVLSQGVDSEVLQQSERLVELRQHLLKIHCRRKSCFSAYVPLAWAAHVPQLWQGHEKTSREWDDQPVCVFLTSNKFLTELVALVRLLQVTFLILRIKNQCISPAPELLNGQCHRLPMQR